MNLKNRIAQFKIWKESPRAKLLAKGLRYVLLLGILTYLMYELSHIGWYKVYQSLPTNPWFYVLFLVLYFALPFSELLIYGLSLKFKFWEGLKVFTIKKMLNMDVLGYSGEAYLYMWAKKNLKETDKEIFQVVKDNNIISSFASTLMAILLLVVFAYVGQINLGELISIDRSTVYLIVVLIAVVIALGIYFRDQIISADRNTALKIFSIHQIRVACLYLLEAFQWSLVLPEVPFHVWLTFISAKIIVSRVPFMPSQDIVFVGISLEMSKAMSIPQEAVAAMLLTTTVLNKVVNLLIYLMFFFGKEDKKGKNTIQSNVENN